MKRKFENYFCTTQNNFQTILRNKTVRNPILRIEFKIKKISENKNIFCTTLPGTDGPGSDSISPILLSFFGFAWSEGFSVGCEI
jgi:hypothetical protein